jgi:hypothetical protein
MYFGLLAPSDSNSNSQMRCGHAKFMTYPTTNDTLIISLYALVCSLLIKHPGQGGNAGGQQADIPAEACKCNVLVEAGGRAGWQAAEMIRSYPLSD